MRRAPAACTSLLTCSTGGRPRKNQVPGSDKAAKPKIDPADKKRGRPSKEIVWDDEYTGPLR